MLSAVNAQHVNDDCARHACFAVWLEYSCQHMAALRCEAANFASGCTKLHAATQTKSLAQNHRHSHFIMGWANTSLRQFPKYFGECQMCSDNHSRTHYAFCVLSQIRSKRIRVKLFHVYLHTVAWEHLLSQLPLFKQHETATYLKRKF